MSDKILQEFLLKLSRSKTAVADAKKQCEFLKRESKKLEKKLEELEINKKDLLQIEETLKVHYICTKVQNEEEFQKNNLEHEELLRLRAAKKSKIREKEQILKETEKLNNELTQITKQRESFEETANILSSKLDQASLERLNAENEAKKNQEILKNLTSQLNSLRNERENLNRAVANTFEEELRIKKSNKLNNI
jgi:chromosome segregation ATPase